MSPIILTQAYDVAVMCAAGMTVMLFYGLLEHYQNKRRPAAAIAFCQDILFWMLAALLASSFLYYCAYGLVSFHSMGAFCVGAAIWRMCFPTKKPQSKR